jgi:HAE1 family hydrophobic/amphiphilic exporter-1
MQAARDGAKEIGFTIVSMTLSLAAVFIPVLFMGGIIGRLFQEFAVVIMVAILVSGFVSLSLTPMMCSERFFDGMLRVYDWTLKLSLRFHPVMTVLFFIVLGATVWLYQHVPKGFLPDEDSGRVFVSTEAQQGISYEDMVRHQRAVGHILTQEPLVTAVSNNVSGGNTGRAIVTLKPRGEREETVDEFIRRMRPKLAEVPGIQGPSCKACRRSASAGGSPRASISSRCRMPTRPSSTHWAPISRAEKRMAHSGLFQDVTSDLQIARPQVDVSIDRDKAAALGVTPAQIQDALYTRLWLAPGLDHLHADQRQYWVIMELSRNSRPTRPPWTCSTCAFLGAERLCR